MFEKEGATQAVLTLLRETKVHQMATLSALEAEGWERIQWRQGGQPLLGALPFPLVFLCLSFAFLSPFFLLFSLSFLF